MQDPTASPSRATTARRKILIVGLSSLLVYLLAYLAIRLAYADHLGDEIVAAMSEPPGYAPMTAGEQRALRAWADEHFDDRVILLPEASNGVLRALFLPLWTIDGWLTGLRWAERTPELPSAFPFWFSEEP